MTIIFDPILGKLRLYDPGTVGPIGPAGAGTLREPIDESQFDPITFEYDTSLGVINVAGLTPDEDFSITTNSGDGTRKKLGWYIVAGSVIKLTNGRENIVIEK